MALKLATAPAVEPITLVDAKNHLRVDVDTDDELIQSLVRAAREQAEVICRRAICTQTWDLYLDAFPSGDTLTLPLPPLQSVTYVKYTPAATGVAATFAAASYLVDIYNEPGRIVLKSGYSWPGDELQVAYGVNVRFVAGYGDGGDVPLAIHQAMLLMVGHWYENREAVATSGAMPKEIPLGIETLLWTHRVYGWP